MIKLDNTLTILYVVCGYYTNRKLHVPGESDNSICPDHKVGVVYAEDNMIIVTGNRIMLCCVLELALIFSLVLRATLFLHILSMG